MSKDTLKTIGWWILAMSVIALVSYGVHSCNKREHAEQEAKRVAEAEEKLQKFLTDKYVYKDINGVYHITKDCYRLDDYYWDKDDNKVIVNYSSQYISRDSIKNWYKFAATHQLCSNCFTPELIQQLDSFYIPMYNMRIKDVLDNFISDIDNNPNITDEEVYKLYPEFNSDKKLLDAAYQYRNDWKANDMDDDKLQSLYPEFFRK